MKTLLLSLSAAMFLAMPIFAEMTPAPEILIDYWVDAHDVYFYGQQDYYYDAVHVFDHMVTATGEGDVHLYLNGEEVSNPYYVTHNLEWEYQQFEPEVWQFTATAQIDGCEIGEATMEIVAQGLPIFYLYHDEESDSFWMKLFSQGSNSISYKTMFVDPYDWNNWIDTDWQIYDGPFKVWYAPQPLYQHCVIEIMDCSWNDGYAHLGMGTILDLKEEIDGFGIYGYDFYDYGFYFKSFKGFSDPSNLDGLEGICNKYLDPQSHAPCYSGDLVVPEHVSVIHKYTFVNCPDLTSIILTSDELSIDRSAFSVCTSLKSISCKSTTPPNTSNSFADESIFGQVTLFVPYEALDAYRAHEEWGRFSRIVPFIGVGPGDINGDGNLSISDVTGIIEQLLSGEDIPAYCDVNGDGKVSITDVTALIDMLLKG